MNNRGFRYFSHYLNYRRKNIKNLGNYILALNEELLTGAGRSHIQVTNTTCVPHSAYVHIDLSQHFVFIFRVYCFMYIFIQNVDARVRFLLEVLMYGFSNMLG